MVRNNTTLVALCALFLIAILTPNVLAITEAGLYEILEGQNFYTPPNGTFFEDEDEDGDFEFPPDNFNQGVEPDLDEGEVYTLILLPGRTVTFESSLTIKVNENANDAIGCIQVLGEAGSMVTMSGVGENDWGGIVILTDPSDDEIEDWQDRFASGNNISYCHILNASDGGTAIVLGDNNVDDAQVWVHNCHFNAQGDNYNAFLTINHGGIYAFQSNYIEGAVATAITCNQALNDGAGDLDEDEDLLGQVISNNHVTSATGDGIQVLEGFIGTVRNNILVDIQNLAIFVDNSANAIVCNNCIVGGSEFDNVGIRLLTAWCEVSNNIFVDLTVGVNGDNVNGDVEYCLFNDIDNDDEFVGGAADEDNDCLIDTDPEFVNDLVFPFDYHLWWTSPAINTGDPDEDYNDPDDSRNDIGAFGGPGVGDFEIFTGDYGDYCVLDEEFWEAPVGNEIELPRDTYHVLQFVGRNPCHFSHVCHTC